MKTEHKCWNCRNSYANLCGWFEFKIGGTEQSIPKGCEYYKNKNEQTKRKLCGDLNLTLRGRFG